MSLRWSFGLQRLAVQTCRAYGAEGDVIQREAAETVEREAGFRGLGRQSARGLAHSKTLRALKPLSASGFRPDKSVFAEVRFPAAEFFLEE